MNKNSSEEKKKKKKKKQKKKKKKRKKKQKHDDKVWNMNRLILPNIAYITLCIFTPCFS